MLPFKRMPALRALCLARRLLSSLEVVAAVGTFPSGEGELSPFPMQAVVRVWHPWRSRAITDSPRQARRAHFGSATPYQTSTQPCGHSTDRRHRSAQSKQHCCHPFIPDHDFFLVVLALRLRAFAAARLNCSPVIVMGSIPGPLIVMEPIS